VTSSKGRRAMVRSDVLMMALSPSLPQIIAQDWGEDIRPHISL